MKKFQKIGLHICLAATIIVAISPLKAFATTDQGFYSSNDILFYNSDDTCGNTVSTTTTGTDKLDGYTLPASSGKTGNEDEMDTKGRLIHASGHPTVTFHDLASTLTQPYRDYYITMRWSWTKWNWNGTNTTVDNKQLAWMKKSPRIILVTNKRTGKSVNAAALESGPAPWTGVDRDSNNDPKQGWNNPQSGTPNSYTGRVSGLPTKARNAIGAKQGMYDGKGDVLTYQWATDQSVTPGPTNAAAAPSAPTVATPSSLNLQQSAVMKQIYSQLTAGGMSSTQAAAIMGNLYTDSELNSDLHEPGNDIGYGLSQWSKTRRTALETFASSKGTQSSDITTQIEFLLKEYKDTYKSVLDKTDFKDTTDIAKATTAWLNAYEQVAKKPANDPAELNSKRIPAAKAIFGLYGGGSTTDNGCNSTGNGVVANDIVSTALNLSLKKPATNTMNKASDATPAYIEALDKYNHGANPADCAIFVGTVMIASGADTNYPKGDTSAQLTYVKDSTNKYKIIENPKRSDLQPGDILLVHNTNNDHHTQIYTGESPYPIVDASLNERVPSVRSESSLSNWMLKLNGVIIARLIKQ